MSNRMTHNRPRIAEGGLKLFKLFYSFAAFGNALLDAVVFALSIIAVE